MRIDLTLGLWQILTFAAMAAVFLIHQYIILASVQKWVKDHERVSDEAMKVLRSMVTDLARVAVRLDGMEKRVERLERGPR